jgi:uncharacterized iron-regulated membrane protein
MAFWQRWVHQPQSVWARKAFFQVHLWLGIGAGLYILPISISGSAIVCRSELIRAFARPPLAVAAAGRRMSDEDLKQTAQRLYPSYTVDTVFDQERPDRPVEIWLLRGQSQIERLFNPYTGADLGDPLSPGYRAIQWLVDFHDNLLSGRRGRTINLIGGILVTLLALTGAVIWWPGIKSWRRGLTIGWNANLQRFNFDLHSAVGIWLLAFVVLWGVSGIYLSSPLPFNALVDLLQPAAASSSQIRAGDRVLYWLAQLHFGRFAGWYVKLLWTALGLAPTVLFITGALMWWNRVLRKNIR